MERHQDKQQLKQQAKDLLLKGCYKMAYNKYKRLIELNADGFTQRQWAVIHVNQAISLQFLQNYTEAQHVINRAIQIDPTYQKSYYRKVQIFYQTSKYAEALACVPSWIKNKQIDELLQKIKSEYLSSLGIDELLENMLHQNPQHHQMKEQFIIASHQQFYHKVSDVIQQISQEKLKRIGQKIAKYFLVLHENYTKHLIKVAVFDSFLLVLRKFMIFSKQNKKHQDIITKLMLKFWSEIQTKLEQTLLNIQNLNDSLTIQQHSLLPYMPLNSLTIKILNFKCKEALEDKAKNCEETLIFCSRFTQNIIEANPTTAYAEELKICLESYINGIQSSISVQNIHSLNKKIILCDQIIKLYLFLLKRYEVKSVDLFNFFILRYSYINPPPENQPVEEDLIKVSINESKIIQFIEDNMQNFLVLYVFEQIVQKLDRNTTKKMISFIEYQMEMQEQTKKLRKTNPSKQQLHRNNLETEFKLIYTSIILKIDIKYEIKFKLKDLFVRKQIEKHEKHEKGNIFADISFTTLLLLCLNNKHKIIQLLQHGDDLTILFESFLKKNSFQEQIQSIRVVLNLMYVLICDTDHQQIQFIAKKMSVSNQEVQKAKQIQGEKIDQKLQESLKASRTAFKQLICKSWVEIITGLSHLLLTIKSEQNCLIRFSKILNDLCSVDHQKLYHSKIIEVELQAFKYEAIISGEFFSKICKKINTQLIKYQYWQSIANVLVNNVQNAQHQLVIFQSLLGLINFSSSPTKVKIPLQNIEKCLFQENQYIVHSALELINNILVESEGEYENQPIWNKLKEIIIKYTNFYREKIENPSQEDQQLQITDYSNPSRVYGTLLSLCIILDIEGLKQFQSWASLAGYLLKMKGTKYITLFKTVLYMYTKQRLGKKWWEPFERELEEMRQSDKDKWIKVKQLMKV